MWVLTLACLTGILYQTDANAIKTFKWSKTYTLKAVLTVPTANLKIPYQVWYNENTQKSRVDFYGGLDKLYRQWNSLSKTYDYFKVHPDFRTNKDVCNKLPSKTAETQTYALNSYLPEKSFSYVRPEKLNNVETHKFIYQFSKSIKDNTIANVIYTVWVKLKKDGTAEPVRFVYQMKRDDVLLDEFSHDYIYFDNKSPDAQILQMPVGMSCIPLANAYLGDSLDILLKYFYPELNNIGETISKPEVENRTTTKSFQWNFNTYHLKAVLTVPKSGIIEPYQVWFDGDSGKARVDFYNGMETQYLEYNKRNGTYKYHKIYPSMDNNNKKVCSQIDSTISDTTWYDFISYLPSFPWEFDKTEPMDGIMTEKYVYKGPANINTRKSHISIFTIWIYRNESSGYIIPKRFDYELIEELNLKDNNVRVLDYFSHSYTYFSYSVPHTSIEKHTDMDCNTFQLQFGVPIDPLVEFIAPHLEYNRIKETFHKFQTINNKGCKDEDEQFIRMNTFKDNLRYINSHNRQHKSFTLGVNHLADLSKDDIATTLGTIKISNDDNSFEDNDNDDDDDDYNTSTIEGDIANFDWRNYGAVSRVKDQTSMCAGCYAFTAAAAIESSAYVARGCKNLEELSEQAIIDCTWGSKQKGNFGCAGGTYENALRWAATNGIPLKSEYGPYLGMEGQCKVANMTKLVKISSYRQLDKKKRVIKNMLRKHGPLLAALDTSQMSFLFYSSGIYDEPLCSNDPSARSHGVTIIGYGRALVKESITEYWIIKNSFGTNWGEKGYMRIDMKKNMCGLKNDVYFVNFKTNTSPDCKLLS
ncbi:hypothetical protein O0L34_g7233 [Tuta absoluta]|nr:hypothetical protein O0L34_g7233 [Tuta absoluta]